MKKLVSPFVTDYYCDACGEYLSTNDPQDSHDEAYTCIRINRNKIEDLKKEIEELQETLRSLKEDVYEGTGP